MVLSGRLIGSGEVEGFGANVDHGSGRDEVGAVIVRSSEPRSRTLEGRTPFCQSLQVKLVPLYAYFLPFFSSDRTFPFRSVLLIEVPEGEVKQRSCPL